MCCHALQMLAHATNPRVVGIRAVIIDTYQDRLIAGIVMEKCETSLEDRILAWQQLPQAVHPSFAAHWRPEPSWPVLQCLLLQAAKTLAELHGRGPGRAIIHNDLRSPNFLLHAGLNGWEMRLCDFGLATAAAAAKAGAPGAAAGALPLAAAAGGVLGGTWLQAAAVAAAAAPAVCPEPEALVPRVTEVWQSLAPELWLWWQDRTYRVTGATDVFALGGSAGGTVGAMHSTHYLQTSLPSSVC